MYDGIFIKETLSRIFKEGPFQSESNMQLQTKLILKIIPFATND